MKSNGRGGILTTCLVLSLASSLLVNAILISLVIYRTLYYTGKKMDRNTFHTCRILHTKNREFDMFGYVNIPSLRHKNRQEIIFDEDWNQVMLIVDDDYHRDENTNYGTLSSSGSRDEVKILNPINNESEERMYETQIDLYCCPETFSGLRECRLFKDSVILTVLSETIREVTGICKEAIADVNERYGSSCEEGEVLIEDFGIIQAVKVGYRCRGGCERNSFTNFVHSNPHFNETLDEFYEKYFGEKISGAFEHAKQTFGMAEIDCQREAMVDVFQVESVQEAILVFTEVLDSTCRYSQRISMGTGDAAFEGICGVDEVSLNCQLKKDMTTLKKPREFRRF